MVDETSGADGGSGPLAPSFAPSAPRAAPVRSFGGIAVSRLALAGTLALTAVWVAWASKGIADLRAHENHLVKARLSEVVSDYVQATARSGATPDQVSQQTANFLRVLNESVTAHGANGQIVLLANAIVAGEVPDITDQIRAEVYAKVPKPAPASNNQVQAQMKEFMSNNAAPAGGGNGH